jgi:signal recognition particle subunit SRP54
MFDFISQKFSSLFSQLGEASVITPDDIERTLQTVESSLLEADVPYAVVQNFVESVKNEVVGQKIIGTLKPAEQLMKLVEDKIVAFLGGDDKPFAFSFPATITVMGLQGSGKTTTIGKLAHLIKKEAAKNNQIRKIMIGSIDFYRPAAIAQAEILAKQVGVTFYRASRTDPVAAAQEIYSFYQQNNYDILLLDTAGRLHIDNAMLQELQEVDALLQPTHKFLVLDAMTGQESLAIAKAFNDIIGFHGAILTKMDSDTRGGAAFAFRFVLKKPILFVGEGEKMTDLNPFYPDRAAERMLGMGDIRSLIEKAEEKIAINEQEKAEKALKSGSFSLQDFADQLTIMNQLGSLSQLLKYMPGARMDISADMIQKGEVELIRFRAIISSMTAKERLDARILSNSRINRIAKGAGVRIEDVSALLKRFEEAKQYVKLLIR